MYFSEFPLFRKGEKGPRWIWELRLWPANAFATYWTTQQCTDQAQIERSGHQRHKPDNDECESHSSGWLCVPPADEANASNYPCNSTRWTINESGKTWMTKRLSDAHKSLPSVTRGSWIVDLNVICLLLVCIWLTLVLSLLFPFLLLFSSNKWVYSFWISTKTISVF